CTLATARRTPFPSKRAWSPSRSSTASCRPVLAPDGTMARPKPPPWQWTSTSTVGLPRLSNTSRAWTRAIESGFAITTSAERGETGLGANQYIFPAREAFLKDAPGEPAHRFAFRLLRQVIDGTGAVNAREGTDREVLDAALFQIRK